MTSSPGAPSYKPPAKAGVSTARPGQRWLYGLLGAIVLVVSWQVLSMVLGEVIIASPGASLQAFVALLFQGATWAHIAATFQRLVAGLLIGSLLGIALGLAAGLNAKVRWMLEPVRWVAMTVPSVVIALVAMLWFGMGGRPVIFVAAVVVAPYTYVSMVEGILAIDKRLIEMGRSFRFTKGMMLTEIYLPGIESSLIAALTLTVGMGVRVVVLSELLSAQDGIGASFSRAWTRLDTPSVFAWLLISLLLLGLLEFGLLRPLKAYITRWRVAP